MLYVILAEYIQRNQPQEIGHIKYMPFIQFCSRNAHYQTQHNLPFLQLITEIKIGPWFVIMVYRPRNPEVFGNDQFLAPSAYLPLFIPQKFPMLLYFSVIVNKLLCIPSFYYKLKKASTTTPATYENHKVEVEFLRKKNI